MSHLEKLLFPGGKLSYAQCGEDLIIDFILNAVGKKLVHSSYLDIGTHDPVHLNNTFYFYRTGASGVCVEPDSFAAARIRKKRPRDTCLNVGVGASTTKAAPFYVMESTTLSTFSKERADELQRMKHRLDKVLEVPLVGVNEIVEKHFGAAPSVVSIDVEGLDLEILSSFDFSRWRPEVFCVETLGYSTDRTAGKKDLEIVRLMEEKGYFVFADTYINTVFVDRSTWAGE